jgi:hypothetical protein
MTLNISKSFQNGTNVFLGTCAGLMTLALNTWINPFSPSSWATWMAVFFIKKSTEGKRVLFMLVCIPASITIIDTIARILINRLNIKSFKNKEMSYSSILDRIFIKRDDPLTTSHELITPFAESLAIGMITTNRFSDIYSEEQIMNAVIFSTYGTTEPQSLNNNNNYPTLLSLEQSSYGSLELIAFKQSTLSKV